MSFGSNTSDTAKLNASAKNRASDAASLRARGWRSTQRHRGGGRACVAGLFAGRESWGWFRLLGGMAPSQNVNRVPTVSVLPLT